MDYKTIFNNLDEDSKKQFDLGELAQQARQDFLYELKQEFGSKLKSLFSKKYSLLGEKEKAERSLKGISEKLDKVEDKISKIQEGNWDLLFNLKDNDDQRTDQNVRNIQP